MQQKNYIFVKPSLQSDDVFTHFLNAKKRGLLTLFVKERHVEYPDFGESALVTWDDLSGCQLENVKNQTLKIPFLCQILFKYGSTE